MIANLHYLFSRVYSLPLPTQLSPPSDLNAALLENLYLAGARVFSNSWGGKDNGYSTDALNVDTFMWQRPDALVLFAAGNGGDDAACTGQWHGMAGRGVISLAGLK